jgi:hypothetical protein
VTPTTDPHTKEFALKPLASFYGEIFQWGYVCDDLDAAAEWFHRDLGTGELEVRTNLHVADCTVDGVLDPEWAIDVATVNVGDRNIEVIRPVSGFVDIYRDAVRPGHPATLHHFGVEVDCLDEALALAAASGREPKIVGHMPGFAHFAYLDLRSELGHYIEFIELEAAGKAVFAERAARAAC